MRTMMKDTDVRFGRTPFIYSLGREFVTPEEAVAFIMAPEALALGFDRDSLQQQGIFGYMLGTSASQYPKEQHKGSQIKTWNEVVKDMTGTLGMRVNQSDTSLGGNDAINCLWQFNDNDDIIPPLLAINGDPEREGGLGLVYNELYNVSQQLLHLSFGVPEYTRLARFYSNAMDASTANFVNSGKMFSATGLGFTVANFVSTLVKLDLFFVFAPITIPIAGVLTVYNKLTRANYATKYFEFREAMPMYYRYVNTILMTLATNMKLRPYDDEGGSSAVSSGVQGSMEYGYTQQEIENSLDGTPSSKVINKNAYPSFFDGTFDIFNILAKRDNRLMAQHIKVGDKPKDYWFTPIFKTLKEELGFSIPEGTSEFYTSNADTKIETNDYDEFGTFMRLWNDMKARYFSTITGSDKFVSFRIDKNVDSSESISNTVGESALAGFLNNVGQAGKEASFTMGGGNVLDGPVGDIINGGLKFISGLASGVTSNFGIANSALTAITGNGKFDLPEVWQNSSFSKSYNFNLTFRAPCGDPISIFQSVYVPFALLLAGALPRSVGTNAYTSPFICRAYSKGMFAVACGIIENMNITRGDSEFGWSRNMLPLKLNVSFTIRDLSPVMHMTMANAGDVLKSVLQANSTMNEYMMTLSGLGLNERLLWAQDLKRRTNIISNIARSEIANPLFWSTTLGNSFVGKIHSAITPTANYDG